MVYTYTLQQKKLKAQNYSIIYLSLCILNQGLH